MEDILVTILIGGLAGWLAGVILRGRGCGCVGNIIVGIAGSFIGWFIFGLLGLRAPGNFGYLITATIGAIILLAITGMNRRK